MTDKAKKTKTRKPNVGSDPTKGGLTRYWQLGLYGFVIFASVFLLGLSIFTLVQGRFNAGIAVSAFVFIVLSRTLLAATNKTSIKPVGIRAGTSEPGFSAFVDSIARDLGAPAPDRIYFVAEPLVSADEETKYFGFQNGDLVLLVGFPYLHTLTRTEMAALIGHHLAHFVDGEVGHGVRAWRALRSATLLISKERNGALDGVFGSYSRKMLRSIGGVGAAQEHQAEQIAVAAYGTEAMKSGLAKLDDVEAAWDQMLRSYVVPALQHGVHPLDLYVGFEQLVADPERAAARVDDIVHRRATAVNEFSSHNSPFERLTEVEQWPAAEGRVTLEQGDELAHTLLDPQAKSAEIVVGTWARSLINLQTEGQTWDQLADEVFSTSSRGLAARGFAADDDRSAADRFEEVLSWSDTDWEAIDDKLKKVKALKRSEVDERRFTWSQAVVTEAAATSESLYWEHRWSGPPELVGADSKPFDSAKVARFVVDGKPADARQSFDDQIAAG